MPARGGSVSTSAVAGSEPVPASAASAVLTVTFAWQVALRGPGRRPGRLDEMQLARPRVPGRGGEEPDTGVQVPGRYGACASQLDHPFEEPPGEVAVPLKEGTDRHEKGNRQRHDDALITPAGNDLSDADTVCMPSTTPASAPAGGSQSRAPHRGGQSQARHRASTVESSSH
jgi:hypothetical protein